MRRGWEVPKRDGEGCWDAIVFFVAGVSALIYGGVELARALTS